MGQAHLRGDARGLGKVIDNLALLQIRVVDLLCLQTPLEIKAVGVEVFIFEPAPLQQCIPQVAVATRQDEHLLLMGDSVLFLVRGHVHDVVVDLGCGLVPVQESLVGLLVLLDHLLGLPGRHWRKILHSTW